MTTIEQSLREDNDVLRRRIREVIEVNEIVNLVIADIADECSGYVKQLEDFKRLAFLVSTPQTLEHLKARAVEQP